MLSNQKNLFSLPLHYLTHTHALTNSHTFTQITLIQNFDKFFSINLFPPNLPAPTDTNKHSHAFLY